MQVTNLTELIWCEECSSLLRLCHTDERILSQGSDYERFLAICHAIPMLVGHPYSISLKLFLKERFSITLTPSPNTAAEIWHTVADQLLHMPLPTDASLPKVDEVPPIALPTLTTLEVLSFLDPVALLNSSAKDWEAWKKELEDWFSDFIKRDGNCLQILLTDDVCRQKPSKFHVDLALKRRTAEAIAILTAQLVRFSLEVFQRNGQKLILEIDARQNDPARFLQTMERAVGLPPLYIVAKNEFSLQKMLSFASLPHKSPIFLAVKRSDDPPRASFEVAIRSMCRRCPLGCLRVIDHNKIKAFMV